MIEEWRDIKGYEGKYQVSNLGNVRSLNYNRKGIVENLKFSKNMPNGYLHVILYKNSKFKSYRIHRLVAEYFIPNPENKLCVNHIDGNKLNNNANNLEWCSSSENNKHVYECGLKKATWANKKGTEHPCSRNVAQFDKNGNLIKEYPSVKEASKQTKTNRAGISNCLNKRTKLSGGYVWRYI